MKAHRSDDQLVEQAAQWVASLEDLSPEKRAMLADWLMESPRHLEEFFLMTALDRELDGIDADGDIPIARGHAGIQSNVVALEVERPNSHTESNASALSGKTSMSRATKFALVAALGGLVVAAAFTLALFAQSSRYSTGVGEIRSFELADGSVIDLNTQSRVKVRFTSQQRTIHLVSGEAMFKVQRDVMRPFRVHAGDAVIQAIGTQFNVYRRAKQTTVSVIEGAVGISVNGAMSAPSAPESSKAGAVPYTRVQTGQEIRIEAGGSVLPTAGMNIDKVTAWRQRRLLFKDDTLADIAEEFNRYNREPRVRIADHTIANKRLSGVFDADAPESLLSFLARNEELSLERTNNEVMIRASPRRSVAD